MTKYGSQFDADGAVRAAGESHNASLRTYDNKVALATEGGTSQAIKIADIGPGTCLQEIDIFCSQDISAINFTVGTAADADKYLTTTAGPNATIKTSQVLIALQLEPTTEREEIFLTPSGNMPSTGTLVTRIRASHR